MTNEQPQQDDFAGFRFNHSNRKPATIPSKILAGIVLSCIAALVLVGTAVLLIVMIGAIA